MPLQHVTEVSKGVRLGLWRMDEEPAQLLRAYPHLCQLQNPYKHAARQREFLCVHALLHAMTGNASLRIGHEESGRPVLVGGSAAPSGRDGRYHVSVSHTRGYAALMLSGDKAVGVDIEYRSDRVAKIASHFVRPDELVAAHPRTTAEMVSQLLILWCAKETLYKLHSADRLAYEEMRADGPEWLTEGCGERMLENLKRGTRVTIHVVPTAEYVLTWAVDDEQPSV